MRMSRVVANKGVVGVMVIVRTAVSGGLTMKTSLLRTSL